GPLQSGSTNRNPWHSFGGHVTRPLDDHRIRELSRCSVVIVVADISSAHDRKTPLDICRATPVRAPAIKEPVGSNGRIVCSGGRPELRKIVVIEVRRAAHGNRRKREMVVGHGELSAIRYGGILRMDRCIRRWCRQLETGAHAWYSRNIGRRARTGWIRKTR